jgi:hypothetical protein
LPRFVMQQLGVTPTWKPTLLAFALTEINSIQPSARVSATSSFFSCKCDRYYPHGTQLCALRACCGVHPCSSLFGVGVSLERAQQDGLSRRPPGPIASQPGLLWRGIHGRLAGHATSTR